MQKLIEHLHALHRRNLAPAPALALAVGVGLAGASLLTLSLEALASVRWWTAVIYMVAFFAIAVLTYRRFSPAGTWLAIDGGRRFLRESGTLDVLGAAKELAARLPLNRR